MVMVAWGIFALNDNDNLILRWARGFWLQKG